MPAATWRAVNQTVEANIDPMGMATPLLHAQMAWLSHPQSGRLIKAGSIDHKAYPALADAPGTYVLEL